jgi:hypothetical protein
MSGLTYAQKVGAVIRSARLKPFYDPSRARTSHKHLTKRRQSD